ncbi:MAG: PqqD family protein [Planctomycetes bacterium]|nr:PqqD family protein [Planctomycetota bacterium]
MSEPLRLSPDAAVAELSGEAVVLHVKDGRYFSANGTGAALLRRLAAGGATRETLADELVRLGADRARATADVEAWLARLVAARLLEGAAGPATR